MIDSIYFKYQGAPYLVGIEFFLGQKLPQLIEFGYFPKQATLKKCAPHSQNEELEIFTYHVAMCQIENLCSYLGIGSDGENKFPITVIYYELDRAICL